MTSRQGLPKAAPEPVTDWEDKYRRLYEKHNVLKAERTEQDEVIKKLNTSIRKLENMNTQIMQQQRATGGGKREKGQIKFLPSRLTARIKVDCKHKCLPSVGGPTIFVSPKIRQIV